MVFKIELERYFNDYRYVTSLVKYLRSKQKLTRIKVANDLRIPFTSYRRIEEDPNFKNVEYISRVVKYFNINDNFDIELIKKLDNDLALFIHSILYGYKDFITFYYEIISHKEKCKNSFLMIFINLTEFIYQTYLLNKEELLKMNEVIDFINSFLDELVEEHRFIFELFKSTYYAIMNDKNEASECHIKVLSYMDKNRKLAPFVYSQLCGNYILLQDWTNALIYAVKSRNLLFETDNYYKLIQNRLAHAEIFYNMKNYEEAVSILESLSSFLILFKGNGIPDQYYILHSCVLIVAKNYKEAFALLDSANGSINLLLIRLYLTYLTNDITTFNELFEKVKTYELSEMQSLCLNCISNIKSNNYKEANLMLDSIRKEFQHDYLKYLVHLMKIVIN